MTRAFNIFGESLVTVYGGDHLSGSAFTSGGAQLGLSLDQIKITPRFHHRDVHTDDFGPDIPPEVLWNLADIRINMTLVHYDYDVLDTSLG